MIWFVLSVVCAIGGLWLLTVRPRPDLTFEAGTIAVDEVARLRVERTELEKALATAGKTADRLRTEQIQSVVAGVIITAVLVAVAYAALLPVSPTVAGVAGAVLTASLWWVPPSIVKTEAAKAHREFTLVFGSYLTFVSLLLAGGSHPDAALRRAAEMGGGRHYTTLRNAVTTVEAQGKQSWEIFREVAERHPTQSVVDVATAVRLAAERGAGLTDSIRVRSAAARNDNRVQIRRDAERASTKMQMPTLVFVFAPMLIVMVGVFNNFGTAL